MHAREQIGTSFEKLQSINPNRLSFIMLDKGTTWEKGIMKRDMRELIGY